MTFSVAPLPAWEEALGTIGITAPGGQEDRVLELLRAFHDRHVPLTPRLARSLRDLERARFPTEQSPWGSAFERAGEALGAPGAFARSTLWARVGVQFHQHVAEPIVRSAAHAVGSVYVLGDATLPDTPWRNLVSALRDFAPEVEMEVERRLAVIEAMGRVFWIEAAMAMVDAVHRSVTRPKPSRVVSQHEHRSHLPFRPDRSLVRLAFEFEPELEREDPDLAVPELARHRSRFDRRGVRPKEGGVAGVVVSRRIEDLQDLLVSELMWPPVVVAQRLVEDGALVRHRPPMRRPRRDVLAITLCDIAEATDAFRILKASWGDAALRSSALLAADGMPKSDLVWAEARSGRSRAVALQVDQLPDLAGRDPMRLLGSDRSLRWLQSGLLPGFVEEWPGDLSALDPSVPDLRRAFAEGLVALGRPALRLGLVPVERSDTDAGPSSIADYRRVIVTHVTVGGSGLGASEHVSATERRRNVLDELRLGYATNAVVHTVALPKVLQSGAAFRFVSDLRAFDDTTVEVPEAESAADALGATLGRLVRALVSITLRAARA